MRERTNPEGRSTPQGAYPPRGVIVVRDLLAKRPPSTQGAFWAEHVHLVNQALAAHRTTLHVVDANSGRLEVVAALGEAASVDTEGHRLEEAVVRRAYETGVSAQAASHDASPTAIASGGDGDAVRAIAVPVTDPRRVVHGVLYVARPPQAPTFSPPDAEVLSACAAAIATHLELHEVTNLYHRDLAHRLRELDEARTANSAKTELISNVSHELRTPLNAVHGFTQILELELAGSTHAATLKYLRAGADHLRQLIDDITDIDRHERGVVSMEIAPTPLHQLLEPFLSILAIEADRSGRRLEVEHGVPLETRVIADRSRAHQVLLNLGSNAVKYNRPGGLVRVRTLREDDMIAVMVEDSGIGIPRADLARVFEPFVRLPGAVRSAAGSGLGLSLARSTAEAMGGSLRAASEEGIGSAFVFRLQEAPDVLKDDP